MMSGLWRDLVHALRRLRRAPAFTGVAVATLALGIGANTAVFTLVDGVLLRPLPFPDAEELVSLEHLGRDGQDELPVSPGLYLLYRDRSATLASVGLHAETAATLVVEGQPERVDGLQVTPDWFTTLGVPAARGRTFTGDEALPGATPVVVLSDALWRTRFGADPAVLGTTVDMSGTLREVVGVMPPGFGFPDRHARFWTPLVVDPAQAPLASFFAGGVGRVAEGSSLEAVRAEASSMLGRLVELFPGDGEADFLQNRASVQARIEPLKSALVGDVSTTLWILLGTVGFVLLIACANVANLLLVRAEGRRRELALRVAVGAGRGHVLRTFLGESAALAAAGGALGLLVAFGAVRLTARLIPADLPRMAEVGMDARVLAFTSLVALGCALVFGLFPLLRFDETDVAARLKEGGGGRGGTGGPGRHRLRHGLVVAQVALALVLLVGSGLMVRSFLAIRAADPGFESEGALTARVIVPRAEIADEAAAEELFRTLRRVLEQRPGVEAVGFSSGIPMGSGGAPFGGIEVEDHPRGEDELPVFASQPTASPGFVEAMGMRVVEGRSFQPGDGGEEGRAVLVSRAFADRWWPDASAVGRRLRRGAPDEDWYTIVGVVDDVRQYGLEQPPTESVWFPSLGEAGGELFASRAQDLVVRTQGDPLTLVPVLRRELRALTPHVPLANPRTLRAVFRQATARTSFTLTMLGAASGIALLLGLVGIYGVVSYVVSQRTREFGVRMALGATGGSVQAMVLRQGLALALVGVGVGLVAAAGLSRVMGALLYEVSAVDPWTYLAVAAALTAVAALASWLPALRAARVDPSRALRAE